MKLMKRFVLAVIAVMFVVMVFRVKPKWPVDEAAFKAAVANESLPAHRSEIGNWVSRTKDVLEFTSGEISKGIYSFELINNFKSPTKKVTVEAKVTEVVGETVRVADFTSFQSYRGWFVRDWKFQGPPAGELDLVSDIRDEIEFKHDLLNVGETYHLTLQEAWGDAAPRVEVKNVFVNGMLVRKGRFCYQVADFGPFEKYRGWLVTGFEPVNQ